MKLLVSTILLNLKLSEKSASLDNTVSGSVQKKSVDACGHCCYPTLRSK